MNLKKYLYISIIGAMLGLLSLTAQAQKTQRTVTVNGQVLPVPDDATTGTARAVVGITIPVVDPNTCTSTNNNCYRPGAPQPSGGASGTQCGLLSINAFGAVMASRPCQGYDLQGRDGYTTVYYDNPAYTACVESIFGPPWPCDITAVPAQRITKNIIDGSIGGYGYDVTAFFTDTNGGFGLVNLGSLVIVPAVPAIWMGCTDNENSKYTCPAVAAYAKPGFDPAKFSVGSHTNGVTPCPPTYTREQIVNAWDDGQGRASTAFTCIKL
jgi:hypothetical protein